MRITRGTLAAVVVTVSAFGCAAPQPVEPRHLDDPRPLIGKTIRFQTPEGHTETIVVTRVEGTTVIGRRPWDVASAVRPPDELTFDLRSIVGTEASRIAADDTSRSPRSSSEAVASSEPSWSTSALIGNTIRIFTKNGVTEVIVVTRVEGTTLTGYRRGDTASAVRGPDELTFDFRDIERIEMDRSGEAVVKAVGFAAALALKVLFTLGLGLLVLVVAL